jgi:hypothetical protein
MPSLASAAIKAVNLASEPKIASASARRWGDVWWSCSSAEDVLGRGDAWDYWPPTGSNRFNEQSRGRGPTGGCNNQLWVEEMEKDRHNNYSLSQGPPSTACLAPKHNNQPYNNVQTMSNDSLADEEPNGTRSKQQSAKWEGGLIYKICCCLVFISFYSCN